jgi:hypothetical protein
MLDERPLSHVRRHWAVFAGLLVALAIWCAVDVSRRAVVDPDRPSRHMTDFTVYTEAGAAFFDGREPYEITNIRGWKYLYPPLFALLVSPLAALSPPWQATVFFGISVGLCLGSYFECRRLLAVLPIRNPVHRKFVLRLCAIAGLTVLFPTLNCLQRGQIGVVLLYPLLLGFRLVVLGHGRVSWFAGGVVLALPVVLKLTPILPVGCLLLALFMAALFPRRGRTERSDYGVVAAVRSPCLPLSLSPSLSSCAGALAGVLLFALLIPAGLLGWHANLRHLETWYMRVATKVDHDRTDHFAGDGSTVRNQSLSNAVQRFGNWAAFEFAGGPDDRLIDHDAAAPGAMPMDRPLVHRLLLAARGIAALVLLAAVVALGRRGDHLSLGLGLGLSCVATFVVSPVARGHYFLLYLPAVIYGGLWMRERRSEKSALWFAAVPMLLCLVHYLALRSAGRIGLLGIGTTVWFFYACGFVMRDVWRRSVGESASDQYRDSANRLMRDAA